MTARRRPTKRNDTGTAVGNASAISFNTVCDIAGGLPGVEISTSYGTPALKVRGKLFARLHQSNGALVLHSTLSDRQALIKKNPKAFFVTDHYLKYPWVLAQLAAVDRAELATLVEQAWRLAAPKSLLPKVFSAAASKTDTRLFTKLSKICLALPEAESSGKDDHTDFRVRGKVFAYYLHDHHGDGIVSVCCKGSLGENVDRASRDPERFYLPAHIGSRGWFGLRLDRKAIDWQEVQDVVRQSYSYVASKRLVGKM